jgi:hypothetical protein
VSPSLICVKARVSPALLDITMSLDSFIAGPHDDVSRLHERLFNGSTPSKYTTLTKIEGDFVRKPSVQVIAKIAKALSIPIDDLIR